MSARQTLIQLALVLGVGALLIYTPLVGVVTDWFSDRATDSIVDVVSTTTTTTP